MERLTEKGVTYGSCEFMDDGIYTWINRLSDYEDTGLTPEEIQNDVRIHREMWEEKYYALRDDRDYWKGEALKHCAKLGEIKILMERAYE